MKTLNRDRKMVDNIPYIWIGIIPQLFPAGFKPTETILYFVKQYCSTRYRTIIIIFCSHAGQILQYTGRYWGRSGQNEAIRDFYEYIDSFPFYFVRNRIWKYQFRFQIWRWNLTSGFSLVHPVKITLICMIFEYVILDFESSECKVDLYILVERELELFNFYIMLILI